MVNFWKFLKGTPLDKLFTSYGWFHLVFLISAIVITICLCVFLRDTKQKTANRIIFIGWLIIFIFELYKEFIWSFHLNGEKLEFGYQWYIFPYQFCSTPFYALPLYFLAKEGKFKNAVGAFISTYVLFGGLAVMLYPGDCLNTHDLGICIQTLVHHSTMMILGFYMLARNRKQLNYKYFLSSVIVFACFAAVAIILNETMIYVIPAGETFNMFYISSHFNCTLPILNMIYPVVPYIVFLLIYLLGFTAISAIFTYSAKGIYSLVKRNKNK